MDELKEQVLELGLSHRRKGDAQERKPFSIRFELVKADGDNQDIEFLDELWFATPVPPDWHDI